MNVMTIVSNSEIYHCFLALIARIVFAITSDRQDVSILPKSDIVGTNKWVMAFWLLAFFGFSSLFLPSPLGSRL